MAKEKKATKLKKKWYKIVAPPTFNNILVGETLSYDSRLLIGKTITVNLANLTNNIKKQSMIIKLRVVGFKEERALTQPIEYITVPTFIKRIIRRGRENLHDSFLCITSDEKNIRIKPLVITVNKTKGVVIRSLNKKIRSDLKDYIRKISFDELVNELVSHKLQNNMKSNLKKIYPLRSFEIKEMRLVSHEGKDDKTEKQINKTEEKKQVKENNDDVKKQEEKSGKKKEKDNKSRKKDNSDKKQQEIKDKE
ncbi:MAG: hypothetical protein PHV16_04490 [Candidatus Nanoarchaeia archaeon]|nr:hypothetical protein [Candidatus Nanoarchaeia archaeon]